MKNLILNQLKKVTNFIHEISIPTSQNISYIIVKSYPSQEEISSVNAMVQKLIKIQKYLNEYTAQNALFARDNLLLRSE